MDHYLPSLVFLYTKKRQEEQTLIFPQRNWKPIERCRICQNPNITLHLMITYTLPQRTSHVSRLRSRRNRWKVQIIELFIGTRFPCLRDFLIRFIRDFPKIDTGFASCSVSRDIVPSVACPMLSNDVNFFSGTMSRKNLCHGWNARTKRVVEPGLNAFCPLMPFGFCSRLQSV